MFQFVPSPSRVPLFKSIVLRKPPRLPPCRLAPKSLSPAIAVRSSCPGPIENQSWKNYACIKAYSDLKTRLKRFCLAGHESDALLYFY